MDSEVHLIWEFISTKNNWLTLTHTPGVFNKDADREFRKHELRQEWIRNRRYFHYITKKLNVFPSIKLFASRLNTQLLGFISYLLDPKLKALNTFIQSRTDLQFYTLPPIICLPRAIQKIRQDGSEVILVVPDCPSQLWYSQFCNMFTKDVLLPPRQYILLSPTNPYISHPSQQTLPLKTATFSNKL